MDTIQTKTARYEQIIGLTNTKSGTRQCRIWLVINKNDSFGFYAQFTDETKIWGVSCSVEKANSRVELHDIDTPIKSGLGAVLMWLVCEYAVGRRLLVFYVTEGVSPYWEKTAVPEGWLNVNRTFNNGEFQGRVADVLRRCRQSAIDRGWDITPLEGLRQYIRNQHPKSHSPDVYTAPENLR